MALITGTTSIHATGQHIDWDALVSEARAMQARAYCPYSHHPVGAAGVDENGTICSGCNVENAAYEALHAEWNMVGNLYRNGGTRLIAMVCVVGDDGEPAAPCGMCRQVIYEPGGDDLLVLTGRGVRTMADLLPDAFGPLALANGQVNP